MPPLLDIHALTLIQSITWAASFVCLITLIIVITQRKNKMLYVVPELIFILHICTFYTMYYLSVKGIFIKPTVDFFTLWSSYIRLHAVATGLIYTTAFIYWRRLWKH